MSATTAERQAGYIADVLRGVLTDLGIDPDDEQVRAVIVRRLRGVAVVS
jgi:hypothetical protein